MRRSLTLGVSLALLIVPAAAALPAPGPAPDNPLSPEPESRNNDVVMMIHGHVEPDPTGPAPPAHEAAVATNEDGTVRLAVIPYSPDAQDVWRPNDLSGENPELLVHAPGAGQERFSPNVAADDHDRCEDETTIEGHEGPLSACLVFEFEASSLDGRNAPTLELHWDGGMEAYNIAAHVLMHDRFEGGPVPVSQADGLTGEPTPFAVSSHADVTP